MLSKEEKHEIELEMVKFPHKQSACLEVLKVIQRHRRFVSDEGLKDAAEYLEMSETELDGIASFYNLIYRKPVGKHVVRVCDSVSCWILGYDKIVSKIKSELGVELGQTTTDNLFTVLPAQCLGTCDRAPALMIGDDLHRNIKEEDIVQILKSYKDKSDG